MIDYFFAVSKASAVISGVVGVGIIVAAGVDWAYGIMCRWGRHKYL